MDGIVAAGMGAALGALLNGFWHVQRWNLRPPVNYLVGVATTIIPPGVAVGLTSGGNFSFLVTLVAIFVPSGAVICILYWLDRH